jgi:cell division septum initiation protein DivIVA
MTDSPRWERESQEDLRPPEHEPQPTTEMDVPFPEMDLPLAPRARLRPRGAADARDAADEDTEWPDREPRLGAARESLEATRESVAESLAATRESLSVTATRVGRWLHSLDRRPEFGADTGHDPVAELTAGDAAATPPAMADPGRSQDVPREQGAAHEEEREEEREEEARPLGARWIRGREREEPEGVSFPTAALGYNRDAVDEHIADLEQEIAELRERIDPPVSITEEIERLGEQTASILVVAHDKAHETARRAQERAARAVREAAEDADRITAAAQRRLRELDEETDAVWRERERLLEDVREVSRTLATLADAAAERFPAAPEPTAAPEQTTAPEQTAAPERTAAPEATAAP